MNSFFEVRLVTGSAEHTTKSNCIGKQTSFTICGRLNISVDIGYKQLYIRFEIFDVLLTYHFKMQSCSILFLHEYIYMNVNIIFSYIFQMNNIYI